MWAYWIEAPISFIGGVTCAFGEVLSLNWNHIPDMVAQEMRAGEQLRGLTFWLGADALEEEDAR